MTRMSRRAMILATGAMAIAPLLRAQTPRLRRVGVLMPTERNIEFMVPLFRKRLSELGWIEGRNLALEVRSASGRWERVAGLAAELVRLKVEVIVTAGTPYARAAKEATATVPIVFAWVADPVASGLVSDLARPGGNLTGLSNLVFEIAPKQFELLKAVIPGLTRVAELRDPKWDGNKTLSARLGEAATRAGVTLIQVDASAPGELERAFAAAVRGKAKAMVVPPLPMYGEQGKHIAELAVQYRIPTAAQYRSFVAAGGLLSYGSDLADGFVRTAVYVDKILRGARPADLPVEQADRFETVINRRAAAALGLTIPPSVLMRADEVIE